MCTLRRFAVSLSVCFLSIAGLCAQQSRIASRIDRSHRVVLRGAVHAQARAQFDRGAVDPSFAANGITLMFKPAPGQQAELRQLLADQQNPSSPSYHKWLTPDEYADRFGIRQSDIDKVTEWLQSEGFTVGNVARGRDWISFGGTAGQVRNSLGTELHHYEVNGRMHFANQTEPSIPVALQDIVGGIRGLNDFHPRPHLRPEYNVGSSHHLVPDDIATIYDIDPLYKAGVDGTGQKIVVVGQTRINMSDITRFRSNFHLSPPDVQTVLVPNRKDPGLSQPDLAEADLDIEWNGAVARNATIVYVYSDDAFEAASYAIDNQLGTVISMSYGQCELADLVDLPTFQAAAQKANALGITWLAASGDTGAADCEDPSATIAQAGLAIDVPGALPEVTSVGGTEFNEGGGTYWSLTNGVNLGSALSYIPEKSWNDGNSGGIASGGGGVSTFFPKPTWQTGSPLLAGSFRLVPDVAFAASANHDGFYVFTNGSVQYYGGTSIAVPTFAGITALLNHYLVSTGIQSQPGVGNINPTLYNLAQNTSGVFHDVSTGTNQVACNSSAPNCSNGLVGYAAGPGFDMATGLGSVDAFNYVHQWSSRTPLNSAVVPSIDQTPVYQQAADSTGSQWRFKITLNEEGGVGTTFTRFTIDGTDASSQIAAKFGSNAIAANGSVSASLGFKTLTVPRNVIFTFGGTDASGRPWSEELSVPFTGAQVENFVSGISNAASGQQVFAPGMIMSVYGAQMALTAQSSSAVPLPGFLSGISAYVNNVPAPLYYVSPTQLNIQIPYETQPGKATLEIDTPYQITTVPFTVSAAGPGIFTLPDGSINPVSRGSRGQTYTLYLTGDGQVTPAATTGTTPAPRRGTPKPVQPVSLTIGGVTAPVTFVGVPSWSIGVTQINFTVPDGAPSGRQPVVVTIGNASSSPALFTVQ